VQLSGTEAGTIYTFDESRQKFRLRATHGMDEEMIAAIRDRSIRVGETVIGKAAAEGTPIQIADTLKDASLVLDIIVQAGFRALLTVPLLRSDQIIGALVVRRKEPGEFPEHTVKLLQTFADQSVLTIQNARLFREIEDKSHQLEEASQHKSQFLAKRLCRSWSGHGSKQAGTSKARWRYLCIRQIGAWAFRTCSNAVLSLTLPDIARDDWRDRLEPWR
jgi:signal transduction protein with GAF and PtsI domain